MEQPTLFDMPQDWEAHWQEMPHFRQDNLMPWQTVMVHFRTREDREAFASLIGQRLSDTTKYAWFPPAEIPHGTMTKRQSSTHQGTQHPIYIISKGRAESRMTAMALDRLCLPYRIVIEPQEYEGYAAVIDPACILTLPFSNLGQGSIPARNWVWDQAVASGATAHWILDDNIDGFFRLTNNLKVQCQDENPFAPIEAFVARYSNIALAGMNYDYLAKRKDPLPPFVLNTRIYSCILINHAFESRWRGRYNEDTDLSLRALKAGWCTVLFNAWLCDKTPTLTMAGGNTDDLYQGNGRLLMAQALQAQHPDVVTVTQKFNRPQHQVNYAPFKRNALRLKSPPA